MSPTAPKPRPKRVTPVGEWAEWLVAKLNEPTAPPLDDLAREAHAAGLGWGNRGTLVALEKGKGGGGRDMTAREREWFLERLGGPPPTAKTAEGSGTPPHGQPDLSAVLAAQTAELALMRQEMTALRSLLTLLLPRTPDPETAEQMRQLAAGLLASQPALSDGPTPQGGRS